LSHFVQIEGVSKWFGDLQVLDKVSLDVPEHNVVCLIGASGSGKSTLLRCLNLLEHVEEGEITVDGQRLTHDKVNVNELRKKIGIVFQAYNLFPHMTVLQNVMLAPRKALGLSRSEAEQRARPLLRRIGLEAKADEYPDRLSGGQQQRVAIARALAMSPALVLADEPSGNLDTQSADAVFDLLRQVNEERQTTFLIVTHDPRLANRCDRIVELVDGRIVDDRPNVRMAPSDAAALAA
jgi:polar amino acid transport system ATP-binding protein